MSLANFDLTNCEQEPIHILGHIQSYGYLIAIQPDTYSIVHASDNIADLVVVRPPVCCWANRSTRCWRLPICPPDTLVELLNVGRRNDSWETMNPHRLTLNGTIWNLIIHQHQGLILLEWEPVGDDAIRCINQQLIAQALTEVQSSRTLTDLLQNTARRVKTIIGFDRVMVYRFGADWHGQVVAEEKDDHLEPFLGLHYPASDIPRQARELYKVNLVRLIADVEQYAIPHPVATRLARGSTARSDTFGDCGPCRRFISNT